MTLLTHPDGTVHFSQLKAMARSPRHYAHACKSQNEPTRAMRVGTAVHHRVLGERSDRPLEVFPGAVRRGKEWDAFAAERSMTEILTQPEWDDAKNPAEAVMSDPVARALLENARTEVPMRWDDNGIPLSTGGVDVIGDGYLAELKTTTNAHPDHLQRHAIKMLYHAQMSHYLSGACSLGMATRRTELHVIAVEVDEPHCVTVLTLTPEVIEAGEKCVRAWLERLKVCAESGVYPGYVQSAVPWALPEWMVEEGFDE